jgi:hypothetical protein
VKEIWRLFRVFNKSKKEKVRKLASDKTTRDRAPQNPLLDDQDPDKEISTVLDSEESTKLSQENDVKRAILQSLADIADLHERVKKYVVHKYTQYNAQSFSVSLYGVDPHLLRYMEWYSRVYHIVSFADWSIGVTFIIYSHPLRACEISGKTDVLYWWFSFLACCAGDCGTSSK